MESLMTLTIESDPVTCSLPWKPLTPSFFQATCYRVTKRLLRETLDKLIQRRKTKLD